MKAAVISVIAALAVCRGTVQADSVQVTLRGVEFPPGKAEEVLRANPLEARYAAVAEAVDRGTAADVETAVIHCETAVKATHESGRWEFYPVEHESSGTPSSVPATPGSKQSAIPWMPGNAGNFERVSAFGTRHTGTSFEAEVRGGGGRFVLTGFYEFVAHDSDRVIQRFQIFKGWPQQVSKPHFRSSRIIFNLPLTEDQWMMAGMVDSWRKDAPRGTKVVLWVMAERVE